MFLVESGRWPSALHGSFQVRVRGAFSRHLPREFPGPYPCIGVGVSFWIGSQREQGEKDWFLGLDEPYQVERFIYCFHASDPDSLPPPVAFSPPNAPPISAPLVPILTFTRPQSEPLGLNITQLCCHHVSISVSRVNKVYLSNLNKSVCLSTMFTKLQTRFSLNSLIKYSHYHGNANKERLTPSIWTHFPNP